LALLGAVLGDSEGIAILLDQGSSGIVRLRTGEQYSGWTLRSVRAREATLQKEPETIVLALPAPNQQDDLKPNSNALPSAPPFSASGRPTTPVSPGIALPRNFKHAL